MPASQIRVPISQDAVAKLKQDIAEMYQLASEPGATATQATVLMNYADGITHALHTLGLIR